MENSKGMLDSIYKKIDTPELHKKLGNLALRRLSPILVSTMSEFTSHRKPSKIMEDYANKQEFFGPSSISQKELMRFSSLCYETIPDKFSSVELSPIAPIGTNSILTKISQNNTLSTVRGSEVVSDITTQLAVACAQENTNGTIVNLCSMGRVLRLQPFDKDKGYMQHFNLFALCSGGKKSENLVFPMIKEHIEVLLDVLNNLNNNEYDIRNISVSLSDINFLNKLITSRQLPKEEIIRNSLNDEFDLFDTYAIDFPKQIDSMNDFNSNKFSDIGLADYSAYYKHVYNDIILDLKSSFPDVDFKIDFNRKAGLGYYQNICFHIFGDTPNGNTIQLADGGSVDWLAKLKADNKQSMVTSGIGAELIQKLFFSPKS